MVTEQTEFGRCRGWRGRGKRFSASIFILPNGESEVSLTVDGTRIRGLSIVTIVTEKLK